MKILLFISFVMMTVYLMGVCLWKLQLPDSLTETAKWLKWPWKLAWYVASCGGAVLAAPALVSATADALQFLSYLTTVGALIVGMAATVQGNPDELILKVGCWLTVIAATIMVLTSPHGWLFVIMMPVGLLMAIGKMKGWELRRWRLWLALSLMVMVVIYGWMG